MIVKVQPGNIQGSIIAPASKSSMQRACAAALLHKGKTVIKNPGFCDDDKAAVEIIKQMGMQVQVAEKTMLIEPKSGALQAESISCGESGLGIRMFTPIMALAEHAIHVNGTGSLVKRTMTFFDEILPLLGVNIQSQQGFLPLIVKGPLQAKEITVDGSLSSQFLTGLLYAFGESVSSSTLIHVRNLKSKPYVDLTLEVMKHFGFNIINHSYEAFEILPKTKADGKEITYQVEGDWSGASFLLAAGAIAGSVKVTGLDAFSKQADKAFLQALMSAGVNLSIETDFVQINKGLEQQGKAFHFNATDCPDLFPPLVALAANCIGTTAIEGVSRLAHKESNRALTLQQEFAKLGVNIKLQDDLMLIEGTGKVLGGQVQSHHDHRIAMAAAVAALKADGPIEIADPFSINKSYPEFYNDMKALNALVSLP